MSKKTNSPVVASSKEAQLATTPVQAQEVVAQQEALKVQAAKAKRVVREEAEVAAVAADEAAEQALAQVSEELFAGADLAGVQIAQAGGAAASGGAAAGGAAAGGLSTGAIAAIAVGAVAVAAAASSGNDTVVQPAANVPAGTQTNQPTQPGSITLAPGGTPLTANTDVLTGNVFDANQVFTPGGNARVNSLQDEDRLTGTGTNPTLNFVFGNPGDNGDNNITPTLTGIQTINVAFSGNTGTAANRFLRLDLQDATGVTNAVNVTRITDGASNVKVDNLRSIPTTLSIADSNSGTAVVGLNFAASAISGSSDVGNVSLNRVDVVGLSVEQTGIALNGGDLRAATGIVGLAEGLETINLSSNGSDNAVGTLSAEDLRTLNITGASNLRLGTTGNTVAAAATGGGIEAIRHAGGLANVAGSLTAINAAALTGALDIVIGTEINAGVDGTSGQNINLTVTGGAGNDTFRILAGSVEAGDRIIGGAGTNTLQLLGGSTQTVNVADATTNGPTVTGVQILDIRAGQDAGVADDAIAVDARAIADLSSVTIRNEGQDVIGGVNTSASERMTVTLTNVNAATANGIVLLHGTTGNSAFVNNTVNINSTLAGVTTAGVTIRDAANRNPNFSAQLRFDSDNTAGNAVNTIANVNLRDEDTEANSIYLSEFARHTGTVTLTGGRASDVMNLDVRVNADATAAGGSHAYDLTATGQASLAIQPTQVVSDESLQVVGGVGAVGAAQKIQATTVDASAYAGNVVVRVTNPAAAQSAEGAQTIRMGSGRDTVIFDTINNSNAGLTIADTVSGGAGNDILAIDGSFAAGISISESELERVTSFETIRFLANNAGTDNNARGAANAYNLRLVNAVIDANAATGTTVLNVVNDNGDALRDVAGPAANPLTALRNSGLTLDVFALSNNRAIRYDGQETDDLATLTVNATTALVTKEADAQANSATVMTSDRFILADGNANATMIIDGGANRTGGVVSALDTTSRVGHNRNLDVVEFRNASNVSIADLTNMSNVSNLEFTNVTTGTITSTLQLDNNSVDRLVNSTLAAVGTNTTTIANSFEVLSVSAIDASATALTQLTMDASGVTNAALLLNVRGGGGVDNIIGGAGADTITGGAGADVIDTGAGSDVLLPAVATVDIVNFAAATAAQVATAVGTAVGSDTVNNIDLGTNTTTVDQFQFDANVFGIAAGAATLGAAAAGGVDGNFYIVTAGPVAAAGAPVDLNGAQAGAAGAIVFVGATTGTAGVQVYFTANEGSFAIETSTLIATLSGVNTSNINAGDLVFVA